jgi:Trk K+ transport system NAD-binding subunit
VSILFVALIGWRLIHNRERASNIYSEGDAGLFVAEAQVPKQSSAIAQRVKELYPLASEHDITILGLVRRGRRLVGFAGDEEIRQGDHLS